MSTKPCIVCGEQIQSVATRCPHCHQVQSKAYQFFNTGWGAASLFVVGALGIAYFTLKEPVRWADHASTVKAVDVKMKATSRVQGTDIACMALLKNDGSNAWKELVVEANFFASDGQLIDTATQRLGSVILPADGEARVRIMEQAAWESSEYSKCSVTVRHATRD